MAALKDINPAELTTSDAILNHFLAYAEGQGVELYDHQEEAVLELYQDKNVILNTPTGSGKSLVAAAVHFRGVCLKRRTYYTVPIKALANEKFLSLCHTFGAEQVGMITGDATVNPEAPIICCTAEILSNLALREGKEAQVDDVIMDEFHYYSDPDRGNAWQIPLLTLPQARFLLMSATIGDTEFFQKELTDLTGSETVLVQSDQRPVPLEFSYSETPLQEQVEELVEEGKAPVYLVHFGQMSAAKTAQNMLSAQLCSKEEKKQIAEELAGANFKSPYGKEVSKLLRAGIGIHHAGLLPKYRILVEKLTQRGLLKVICGTDTLGVGVNVPIRTVVFTQLCKFDGRGTKILTVRDFKQIAGRAGRRGYDTIGYVVAQAPEHVIENLKMEAKSRAGGKNKKFVKKKPPEQGFVNWNNETFEKLIASAPEKLVSQMRMRHSFLLNVLGRKNEDGCAEVKRLIAASHETGGKKKELRKQASKMFVSLVRGGVLDIIPMDQREGSVKVKLHTDLQDDFSMNQALGLYLLEAIPQLDAESPEYAVNVISLIESIVENPHAVLRAQVYKRRSDLMAELKNEGVSYDQRMEMLDEVDWPKPGEDFIYNTFNKYVSQHAWMAAESVRPKSIAREMLEQYFNFEDYVKHYKLERSEAVLLRHLSEVYKVLAQTVPPAVKNEELIEAEEFFQTMLYGVDSSLLDEWEKIKNPELADQPKEAVEEVEEPLSRQKQKLSRMVHQSAMRLVRLIEHDDIDGFLESFADHGGVTFDDIDKAIEGYFEQHDFIQLDPEARSKKHHRVTVEQGAWLVEQAIVDEDNDCNWQINFKVLLEQTDAVDEPVLQLIGMKAIG